VGSKICGKEQGSKNLIEEVGALLLSLKFIRHLEESLDHVQESLVVFCGDARISDHESTHISEGRRDSPTQFKHNIITITITITMVIWRCNLAVASVLLATILDGGGGGGAKIWV
jgi:5-deoxy-D-glucuronate isomerase